VPFKLLVYLYDFIYVVGGDGYPLSSKKEKFLESAQKFILKGQLDRAIKDYEQVVALDPNDIRHRQRLAELLVRVNRKEEAIGEYEAIGKYYADNAYYLKAIAVYKQVQKLDPGNIKISYNLATLNEKQGLIGNALAEYSRVYSHYDKIGKSAEALTILESMMAIDPENLNTRLKYAETLCASGGKEKAYHDFVEIALLLRQRGDESVFNQVCERVRYLFADKADFALDLAIAQLQSGDAASAVPMFQEVAKKDQGNLKAWQLLAEALRSTGDREELKSVLQKMVRLFPAELSPREGLIQCALDDGDPEGVLFLVKSHGELFLENGAGAFLERAYQAMLERTPDDERLLLGLRRLYEASGEQAKLAEVAGRLGSLKREEVEPAAELPEEDIPVVEECVSQPEEPEGEGEEEAATEAPELPLPEEELIEPSLASEEDSELPGPEEAGGDQLPVDPEGFEEFEEFEEIAIELDLGDDELMRLAEFGNEPEAEDHASESLPGETSPLEELAPPSDAVSLPAEHEFVALGEDVCAEIESEEESAADYDKYSLDGLFSAFKKELDQQLDEEDTETHYNLGIAFKEMGLYDEAINEFQVAAVDPRRKMDCITLQGVCCRDKGDLARAEEILSEGMALQELAADDLSPLKYELALLYEATGRHEDALRLFHEIRAVNPDFRDVAEKVADEYDELDLVELEEGEIE
jgi:tetratricopeptide (TPR) repeat protein